MLSKDFIMHYNAVVMPQVMIKYNPRKAMYFIPDLISPKQRHIVHLPLQIMLSNKPFVIPLSNKIYEYHNVHYD